MLIRRKLVSGSISYQPNAADSIYENDEDKDGNYIHDEDDKVAMAASHTSQVLKIMVIFIHQMIMMRIFVHYL